MYRDVPREIIKYVPFIKEVHIDVPKKIIRETYTDVPVEIKEVVKVPVIRQRFID